MSKTKNQIIDQVNDKQQTIQYLTGLMTTLQAAYFKGHLGTRNGEDTGGDGIITSTGLWIHESMGDSASISIDLYDFGGDGKPYATG